VFENRVLRRIFGLKRDEVTGEWRNEMLEGWRKLHKKNNGNYVPAAYTYNCTKHNGSVVEIATSYNILYDSPEDGHQIGRNMSR
jgi:hypothetical protein